MLLFIASVLYLYCPARLHAEDPPDQTIAAYLTHWQSGEYSEMYDMLSSHSKVLTSRWEFIRAHEKMESQFSIIDFSVYDQDINGQSATVWYRITTKELFGAQKTQEKTARLVKERSVWKILVSEYD